MEKSKVLLFGVLVDVVLKSGDVFTGFIEGNAMQKEADRDFIKLSNKKVTKGVRSMSKRIKKTHVASVAKSTATAPNF